MEGLTGAKTPGARRMDNLSSGTPSSHKGSARKPGGKERVLRNLAVVWETLGFQSFFRRTNPKCLRMSWNFASRTVYTPACTFLCVAVLGKTLLSLSFPSSPDNTSSEIKVGNATPGPEAASALSSGTWSCRHARHGGAQTLPSSRESSWKKEENPKGWGEGRHLHQSSEEGSEPSADRAPGLLGGYAGGMAVLPVPLLPSDQMALSSYSTEQNRS